MLPPGAPLANHAGPAGEEAAELRRRNQGTTFSRLSEPTALLLYSSFTSSTLTVMFATERAKSALRTLQAQFIRSVQGQLARATPPLSIAALGLQKAQINPDRHWPNAENGYWTDVSYSSNKPPRWILQIRYDAARGLLASLASSGEAGDLTPLPNASSVCALNSSSTAPSAGVCAPVWASIKQDDGRFLFPEDWGWLIVLRFGRAIKTATANQALRFDIATQSATTLGAGSVTVPVNLVRILHLPDVSSRYQCQGHSIGYDDATESIKRFLGATE